MLLAPASLTGPRKLTLPACLQHISAVPVVDPVTEQFLGEINARQAYYISIASNKMRLLSMSCRDFIAFVNRKQVGLGAGRFVAFGGWSVYRLC